MPASAAAGLRYLAARMRELPAVIATLDVNAFINKDVPELLDLSAKSLRSSPLGSHGKIDHV